ncbi:MAG: DUF4129 domain-containing protein [Chloroflexia bacterium]
MSAITAQPTDAEAETGGAETQAELLGLACTLLAILWVHPLLALLGGTNGDGTPRMSVWPFVGLALFARGMVWLLERIRVGDLTYRAAAGLSALASLPVLAWLELYTSYRASDPGGLNAISRDLGNVGNVIVPLALVALVAAFIWRQTLSGAVPELGDLTDRALFLILSFGAYVALGWLAHAPYIAPVITRDLFLIFIVGLFALALSRSRLEAGRSRQMLGIRWFVFSLGLISIVLALGVLVSSIFDKSLSSALFGPLLAVVQGIGALVVGIVEIISTVAVFLLSLLGNLLPAAKQQDREPKTGPGLSMSKAAQELVDRIKYNFTVDPALLTTVGGVVVLVILLLVARRVLGSAQRRRSSLGGGERESLLDWGQIFGSFGQAVRGRATPHDPLLALMSDPAYRYTVRVRQAYRRALEISAGRGIVRLPAQTASEVLPALQSVLPEGRDALRRITGLYDAVRYTARPAGPEAAEAAEQAVAALEAKPGR